MHYTSHRAFSERRRPNTLCVDRAYKTLNLELSVVLSVTACELFLLILMVCLWTYQMDGKWLCHYTQFWLPKEHHHQVLKESQVKCVADVVVLDCFMLWKLVFKNVHLKWVYRILCTVCGMLDCCLSHWFSWTANKSCLKCINLGFSDSDSVSWPASLMQRIIIIHSMWFLWRDFIFNDTPKEEVHWGEVWWSWWPFHWPSSTCPPVG